LKTRFYVCFITFLLSITACKENDITKVKSMFDEQSAQIETADSVTFTYKEGPETQFNVTPNHKIKLYFQMDY